MENTKISPEVFAPSNLALFMRLREIEAKTRTLEFRMERRKDQIQWLRVCVFLVGLIAIFK